MVSLQHCFMGWVIELIGGVVAAITPLLYDLGFLNVYYLNVILLFVLTPFMHLMNDEETKGIVSESNWLNGLRHLLGFRQADSQQNQGLQRNHVQNS